MFPTVKFHPPDYPPFFVLRHLFYFFIDVRDSLSYSAGGKYLNLPISVAVPTSVSRAVIYETTAKTFQLGTRRLTQYGIDLSRFRLSANNWLDYSSWHQRH